MGSPGPLKDKYLHFGLASHREVPIPRKTFHRHTEIEFTLVERGEIVQLFAGRRHRLRAGQLAIFWGSTPHLPVACAGGTVLHWLTVPLTWFLQWNLPDDFLTPLLGGQVFNRRAGAAEAASDLEMFRRWHLDLRRNSAERRRLVMLECEAKLRRWLADGAIGRDGAVSPSPRAGGGGGQVEKMAEWIARHYTEAISVSAVAEAVALHPDYARVLFRRNFGLGLLECIVEHRISHAQRLLATTDAKMLEIAFDSGFGSASRFYAAFLRKCGQTPRAYRRSVGAAAPRIISTMIRNV